MKVFLSWSGHKSHEVAKVLRDWIPSVIQSVAPYVSSEDIDKGVRWSSDIAKELEDSSFGILCVTKENMDEPWLLFEAGALSKTIEKTFVCPFLFDIKPSEIQGPILQFQATIYEKEDIKKLMTSLNSCCGEQKLRDDLFENTFETWWPQLKEKLDVIQKEGQSEKPASKKSDVNTILEELLNLTRLNQKILRSPDALMPVEYLRQVFAESIGKNSSETDDIRMLINEIRMLCEEIYKATEKNRELQRVVDDESLMSILHLTNLIRQLHSFFYPSARRRFSL